MEDTRDMLKEASIKSVEDIDVDKVQGFKSETEKKMREHSNRMDEQMGEMHKRFGEEVQVYMTKAKEHMADYLFKPKAGLAGAVNPKAFMRYQTDRKSVV